MAKSFKQMGRQGDVLFIKRQSIPEGYTLSSPSKDGKHVVAHSETGHHHVVKARSADMLIDKTNEFIAFLDVKEPTEVTHERSFDTHETLLLDEGVYEIRRQREYVPEGYRKAAD